MVSTMVTGKPALRKASVDAGAHGAGAEDADRLDVAQLGVGADARQVGGLALGEEGVLQGARVGAGGRLAEHLRARARCLRRAAGWSPPPPRRWRPWARSARSGAARSTPRAFSNRPAGIDALSIFFSPMRRGGLPICSLAKATAAATTSPSATLSIRPAAAPLAGVDERARGDQSAGPARRRWRAAAAACRRRPE